MKLQGKIALVTGSGRGIGREVALKLAGDGASVVVNDLGLPETEAIVEEIRSAGGQAVGHAGDVTSPEFGNAFVATALDAFGGLDIIVNNAGYTWDAPISRATDEQIDAMLAVHVKAPMNILRAAAEPIKSMAAAEKADGRPAQRKVVNISSLVGLFGNAGSAAYSSGKSAVVGLTRSLAKEWGRYGVNVNCVAFGLIETRLTQVAASGEAPTIQIGDRDIQVGMRPFVMETFLPLIPLGRAGTPKEAANAVYLLCIPESDYISGQVLVAGGGLLV